jgi:hypothetical protein
MEPKAKSGGRGVSADVVFKPRWSTVMCSKCKDAILQVQDEIGYDPEFCPGCGTELPEGQ